MVLYINIKQEIRLQLKEKKKKVNLLIKNLCIRLLDKSLNDIKVELLFIFT
jgi:hypothetical protein